MNAAHRRVTRVWLPCLALAASLYAYAGTLSTTINGLGLLALACIGTFTMLAARDGSLARKGNRHV